MPETRITSASASDLTSSITDYSVSPETTDGASGNGETRWTNEKWAQYLGYYKTIPELRAVIDAKATWTVGKGYKADPQTKGFLGFITGIGGDTLNTVLENLIRTMQIGGDAFAEVIRDDEGNLINLKPLDPATMSVVVNSSGIIIRYEQTSKSSKIPKKYGVMKIFHLMRNRVADEIHGQSLIESLEWIILAKNEVQSIFKEVMQKTIRPIMIFHLDTDDPTEIEDFQEKMDGMYSKGGNFYVPKDVVVPEVLAVAPNATANPMAWLEYLNNQFYQASGCPQIILGGSAEFTEASAKIAYLAFQQTIEEDQLLIEEQALRQLLILIELEFPASLENEMLSDQKKDVENGATQPNDTEVGGESQ